MDRTCDPCRVKPSDVHRVRGVSLESARHRSPLASGRLHRFYTARRRVVIQCYTALDKMEGSQGAATLRQSSSPRSSRFGPSGHSVAALETRAARAFAFLGRCFVVAYKPTRRTEQAGLYRPAIRSTGASVRVSNQPAGGNSRRHHKAPSSSGRALTQQTGECRRRTHESDGAMSAPAPAALPQGPQRTGIADRHAIGPRLTGAWKLNVDAQRAVVLHRGDGRRHPSGASGLSDAE
jgi:hypothetical protein